MKSEKKIAKNAAIVAFATFLSRILGFLRDLVIANFFGVSFNADAFFVAFRIPNLFRRLLGEGSLSIAFVPVFTEYLNKTSKEEAFKLAKAVFNILFIVLITICAFGVFFSDFLIKIIAPGFVDNLQQFETCVRLTQIMFPYLLFACMVALCMGILNSLGHFAAPSFSPFLLNLSIIVSVLLFYSKVDDPIFTLAYGVLIGGALQFFLQIPFLIKKGFLFYNFFIFKHPGLKKIAKLMLPSVFGAAIYQINLFINTLLASFLKEGSVSYLYYSDRLVQFPLAIFGLSLATAILPTLSKDALKTDYSDLKKNLSYALRLIFFISIPSMAGLILLREEIIYILFKRGAFDFNAVQMTASALFAYAIGLWAFSAIRIIVSVFYAMQNTKTPVIVGAISIVINLIFALILIKPLGHVGLALATSISSIFNFLILYCILEKKLENLPIKEILTSLSKISFIAILMSVFLFFMKKYFLSFYLSPFNLILRFFLVISSCFILYFLLSFLFKSREFSVIIKK